MLKVKLTHTQKNSRDGSKENPYEPGDILFTVKISGRKGAVDHEYSWGKLIGGQPKHPKAVFPEFRKEGFRPTLGIPPLKTLSKFSYTARVWKIGSGPDVEIPASDTVQFWVMKGVPVPTWWIECSDGRLKVGRTDLAFIRTKGLCLPRSIPYDGKIHYDGTVQQLTVALPDPIEDEDEYLETLLPDKPAEPEKPELLKQKIMGSLEQINIEVDRINGYLFELKTEI